MIPRRHGRFLALFAILEWASGCGGGGSGDLIRKIEQSPTDSETGARLAILGREMAADMLKLLERNTGYDEKATRLRRTACAILYVAGDVCTTPCMEYLDLGENLQVRLLILQVAGRGHWHAAVRQLIGRIDNQEIGPQVYQCLAQILAGQDIPADPWAADETGREERFAQWNRWLGKHAQQHVQLNLEASKYKDSQLTMVKQMIEGELKNPFWR